MGMKKLGLFLLALFMLAGCSSGTQLIGSSLDTSVSFINKSDKAYIEVDQTRQEIELPIELDVNLEETTDKIDIKNPKKMIYALRNGGVCVIGVYEENNNYYLISYAYSLSSTFDKVVVPKNTTNVAIYKANEEVIKQIDNIILKD